MMSKYKKISILLTFLFFLYFLHINNIYTMVIHISGKRHKDQPKFKTKIKPNVAKTISNFKNAPSIEIAKALGSVGTKKIAVVIVDFPDKSFSLGWHQIANSVFNDFKNYYNEVSYEKLNLDITFFYDDGSTKILDGTETPYRLPKNMGYYGVDTEERLSQLIKDALILVGQEKLNKTLFDYVMVLHAGNGNESTNNPEDIWSVYIEWDSPQNGFTDGTIVPERESFASALGVICHEFGHQLGLPDLYYDQESVVGCWCLMDNGVWLGAPKGSKPAHLSAWSKKFLGWIELQIVSSTLKNISLPYIELSSVAVKVKITTAKNPDNEYFLIEYRKKVGFDESLPSSGILIWRIDDEIATSPTRLKLNNINSGIPHLGVDLIAADKSKFGYEKNDAGDPFPGEKNIINFVPQSYNITAYNGLPINIFITNITLFPEYSTFDAISFSGLLAKVSTLDGYLLNNVKIHVYNNLYSTTTYTLNGYSIVELSTGSWNLECNLDNYTTYKDVFQVLPEQLTIKEIILRYQIQAAIASNNNENFLIGNNYFSYNEFDKISFRYSIEEPSDLKILIYDLSGNLINTIERNHFTSGYYEELWDVKDKNGNKLKSGLYFACFKTRTNTIVKKFVIKNK